MIPINPDELTLVLKRLKEKNIEATVDTIRKEYELFKKEGKK